MTYLDKTHFIYDDDSKDLIQTIQDNEFNVDVTPLHVDEFRFEQKRYNNHAVQYDFIFLCADIDKRTDMLEIANKLYRVLKNAGHVFVLSKKESTYRLIKLFEESNFVAINIISLNSEHDIISAKKMHGWMKV